MYGGDPVTMAALRQRALADPAGFLALAQRPCMEKYDLEGPVYKRDHLPAGTDPALKPYLNRKGLSWCYFCDRLTPTLQPALLEEVRQAFTELAPLYRYCCGVLG